MLYDDYMKDMRKEPKPVRFKRKRISTYLKSEKIDKDRRLKKHNRNKGIVFSFIVGALILAAVIAFAFLLQSLEVFEWLWHPMLYIGLALAILLLPMTIWLIVSAGGGGDKARERFEDRVRRLRDEKRAKERAANSKETNK
ncbi:hypothetical protein JXM67_08545 [candidate division WOR-3 bacterium]|nr:hypothetical protein [candidate division WOR-3 bacterium]